MPGNIHFDVRVEVKDGWKLPELQARLQDLSPAFEAFIPEWAKLNEQVFEKSVGHEGTGAQVDDLVFWEPLAFSTMKAKRGAGQTNQIMVATGDLRRALTSPDLIFQEVSAEDAVFGSPMNLEEALKVKYNWDRRQAVFLSTVDQNALRRILKDYLEMGEDFREMRSSMTTETQRRSELASMDAEFEGKVDGADEAL